ncbi:hypothetical protein G7076_02355 [Sphingomonas sp. HDW15A]|uniref:hypothetical protein n=1 Tax=Sphingomonas sp. HDW15A TaxID=2714942 RepID=UPI001407D5DC|nr:hypothetical protein [Sphingomonas sp. HDW15A]QIK95482.1 hypothetical protein G7076_02355 [Sphingomonas sp. HDW15A]
MIRPLLAILLILPLAACETSTMQKEPSLARRSAESIDPRLPVDVAVDSRPLDPALAARLEALLTEARNAAAAFAAAEPVARAKAASSGQPESESWIAAQSALAELERTRAPFTRALGDLDALRAQSARSGDRASAADVAALEAASADLSSLSERQAEALDSIRAQIAG